MTRRAINRKSRFLHASSAALAALLLVNTCSRAATIANLGSMRLDASNVSDLSLVTDLWRSTFGVSTESNNDADGTAAKQLEISTNTIVAQALPPVDLATLLTEIPLAAADSKNQDDHGGDIARMSDWEISESHGVSRKGIVTTKDGPSVVTAIVAIVGCIVVGGAYLKGRQ